MKKVFAFDLGSGSLGECVRNGDKVEYLNSLLIDAEFASTKEQAQQRRGFRTRQAHLARERWWKECAKEAGLEVLSSAQPTITKLESEPDKRMLREFAKEGDDTIYTSCLLRISLLQGKKLESWQVYKAIWSALQHRGYDAHLPWASEEKKIREKQEKGEELTTREKKILKDLEEEGKSSNAYLDALKSLPSQYHYPCYYEAWTLGLWDFAQPDIFQRALSKNPSAARNKEGLEPVLIAPRHLVEKELLLLLKKAAEQYPSLAGKEKFILYGPAEQAYASVNNKDLYGSYRGKEWEWQGLLAQKTPRFDNRALSPCCLISRFHTCKSDTPLNLEVLFLLALKNMRFTFGKNPQTPLAYVDLSRVYKEYLPNLQKSSQNALGKKEWAKVVRECGGVVNETQQVVPMPNKSGRSSFSKPALKILKELILSGENPHEFYQKKIESIVNTDPKKGLTKEDFSFLLAMPNEWNKIHISDKRNEDKILSQEERKEEISRLLSDIKHPIVRHRLDFFWKELIRLEKEFGTPDEVILELVRTDFFSDEQKKEFERQQKENQARNKKLADEVGEKNVLKMRLFMEQGGIDLYDTSENNKLSPTALEEYDIDHIVPQSRGGADSYANKVLTKRSLNITKANKTPYEWLSEDSYKWSIFLDNISHAHSKNKLSDYKAELLISSEAEEMERRRNDLQATAYLEKWAQRITALHFGWGLNVKGEARKIFVVSGAQTAKIRRHYKLDRLLHSEENFNKYRKDGSLDKKNRENKKHHALDALVLSIIRDIRYCEEKKDIVYPSFFTPPFCANALKKVYPQEVRTLKPKLRETIYGLRERIKEGKKEYFIVTRFNSSVTNFEKLSDAKKLAKSIFDPDLKQQLLSKLNEEDLTQETWKAWLKEWSDEGRKIRKMTLEEAGPFTEKDILIKNGRRQISHFYELGKMKGQFFRHKESHKGQIVYKNAKGKWVVEPVYLWESVAKKLAEFKKQWGQVLFFKSGQLVEVRENVGKVKKGIYRIRTIMASGAVGLESLENQEKSFPMIGKLLTEGKMCHFSPTER